MTHEFPADVVRTTDKFAAELGQFNGLNVDDIAQLWRAYSTQSTVVQDAVVSRLENLFWRIWGNVALQQSLTGITLATLFMAIHENPSLRMTRRKESQSGVVEPPSTSPITTGVTQSPMTITTITPNSDEEHKESLSKKQSKSPLPPILKKSTDGKKSQPPTAPSSYKTTRILIPEKPSERPTKDTTKDAAAIQKSTRKKPPFVATRTTSSRRRGVLIRRKSAQNSPTTSPAVERSEESLYEELVTQQEQAEQNEQRDRLPETSTADNEWGEAAESSQLSWRSLSYLKVDENESLAKDEVVRPGTSPPPTNFSLSSVRHHRSPEEHSRVAYKQATSHHVESNEPLVDQDFRTRFIQQKRQEPAQSTTNNSTASSLTTSLSSTNFRELLTAAEAGATKKKDLHSPAGSLAHDAPSTRTSPTRKSERRPMIVKTSKDPQRKIDMETVSSAAATATAAVAESVTSTSGVFSVPKELQEQVGEQLHSLIKGMKTKRGQRKDT